MWKGLAQFIHRHFIWLLLGSYAVAAVCPWLGLAIRSVTLGEITVFSEKTKITLPIVMLAFLLLNAGLGVQAEDLKTILRHPWPLIADRFQSAGADRFHLPCVPDHASVA